MSDAENAVKRTIPVRVVESKPKAGQRRPRRRLSAEPDGLRYDKVHTVEIQGMQVSLPWLDFMARGPR
jgi:hypothetical protein